MNPKLLYSALMLYTCANINNVNKAQTSIEDLCPEVKTGMRLELRKNFNEDKDEFMKTYLLYTEDNTIVYKEFTTANDKSWRLNLETHKISTTGTLEKSKTYKKSMLGRRNEKYYDQLNKFLERLESFDNPRWMNFKLNDVVECIQANNELKR